MKKYDLEHHYFDASIIDYLKGRTEYPYYDDRFGIMFSEGNTLPLALPGYSGAGTILDETTDLGESRLSIMDAADLQYGVVSGDTFETLPHDVSVACTTATNDAIAAACKKYPDRFVGAFSLPILYVEDALKELDRAVNVLGLKYFYTHSNFGECALYDERFEPVLARLAELNVPFYLHPGSPMTPYLCDSGVTFSSCGFGFGVDTMKTSLRLIMSGVFDRYPNLKMILGHMAEFYPYILDRIDNRFRFMQSMDPFNRAKRTFTEYFKNKNIFMTTSGILDPEVVLFAIKKVGIDNILFGSDYPYEDLKESVDFVKSLPISDEYKEKIFYKNAEKYILNIK